MHLLITTLIRRSRLRDHYFLTHLISSVFTHLSTLNYKIIRDNLFFLASDCTGIKPASCLTRNGVYFLSNLFGFTYRLSCVTQKTEKAEKADIKKGKAAKATKEATYELPEIPDYERAVLEKPQEFDFGEFTPREKTKLERPVTQVRKHLKSLYINDFTKLSCQNNKKYIK